MNTEIRDDARIVCNGVDVGLTLGEFEVAARLIRASGAKTSPWVPYRTVSHSMASRIRRKFRAVGCDPIENHTGFGYRWSDA